MPARTRMTVAALRPLLANEAFLQLVRYGIGGLGVTLFAAGVYLLFAAVLHVPPLIANTISTAFGVGIGYLVHSRWSFRAEPGREGAMITKFIVASAIAFALNSFWVWLATHALRLPVWTPVVATVGVTPFVSFLLFRYWTFAKD